MRISRNTPASPPSMLSPMPSIPANPDRHFHLSGTRGLIAGKTVTFIGDGACNVPSVGSGPRQARLRAAHRRSQSPQPCPDLIAKAGGNISVLKIAKPPPKALIYCTPTSGSPRAWKPKPPNASRTLPATRSTKPSSPRQRRRPHALPPYRGKEIDEPTFEAHADTIFTRPKPPARPEGDFELVVVKGFISTLPKPLCQADADAPEAPINRLPSRSGH